MILELIFLSGLCTGILASLILVLFFYREEKKAEKEFDERQEKYKKMI